jgi:hypothetical protein
MNNPIKTTAMFFLMITVLSIAAPLKPRLVVLTDIAPDTVEPDDMQSNHIGSLSMPTLFEIEALIHSTG